MQEIVMRPMKVENLESALELWNSDAGVKAGSDHEIPWEESEYVPCLGEGNFYCGDGTLRK